MIDNACGLVGISDSLPSLPEVTEVIDYAKLLADIESRI